MHSHYLRWCQYGQLDPLGYGPEAVTVLSTPLYSNTTLVCFNPTFAGGGTVVLMKKFDARGFLELSEKHRATHTMLVPVQYRRIMALPDFERFDLTSYQMKFCTSAPFAANLKADILKRWPGGLTEYYGMTEGGGSCALLAHEHPDKLHTVGLPMPDHDVRLIDDDGKPVAVGEIGEIVGHSPVIMKGYLNQPAKTAETFWHDETGKRFVRTGDIGRFDADGFLTLMDRKKDMIISGGFNIYPSDLEAVLAKHDDVVEAAVVAMPSEEWGETPVAFVVLKPDAAADASALKAWTNSRVGKTQRLADVVLVDTLPAQRHRQGAEAGVKGLAVGEGGRELEGSRVKFGIFLLIRRVGILDACEVEQHRRHRHIICRKDRGPDPDTLGPAAAAQRDHLPFDAILLANEQWSAVQPNLLVGEQADRRALDRQAIVPRAVLKQHAEHFHRDDRTAPGIIRRRVGQVKRGWLGDHLEFVC